MLHACGDRGGTKRKRTTGSYCDDSEVNIVCVRTAEDRVKEASRASTSWVIGATLIINEDLELGMSRRWQHIDRCCGTKHLKD